MLWLKAQTTGYQESQPVAHPNARWICLHDRIRHQTLQSSNGRMPWKSLYWVTIRYQRLRMHNCLCCAIPQKQIAGYYGSVSAEGVTLDVYHRMFKWSYDRIESAKTVTFRFPDRICRIAYALGYYKSVNGRLPGIYMSLLGMYPLVGILVYVAFCVASSSGPFTGLWESDLTFDLKLNEGSGSSMQSGVVRRELTGAILSPVWWSGLRKAFDRSHRTVWISPDTPISHSVMWWVLQLTELDQQGCRNQILRGSLDVKKSRCSIEQVQALGSVVRKLKTVFEILAHMTMKCSHDVVPF